MATIQWTGKLSSDFNNTGDWSTNTIPGATDDAVIGVTAAVTTSLNDTVSTLATVSTASLSLAAGSFITFTIVNGSGSGGLAGTINIGNTDVLSISGNIVNSGNINLNSTGNNTEIVIGGAGVTLSGGGHVNLSNSANNFIFGTSASSTLTNVNNTIAGAGNIGDGQMTLVNQTAGIINANQTSALVLNTGGNVITNGGVLEGTGTGGLIIQSAVSNVGGTVKAVGAGAIVALQNTIMGGTVTTASGGVIQTSSSGSGSGLDGLPLHSLTNSGTIQVLNNTALFMAGSIVNNGTISLSSSGNNTDLRLSSPIVTLSGTGTINLGNNINNRIFGNNGFFQLINGSTIAGAGQLGANQMTFINNNLVNANQTTALVLNTGNNIVVNTKTLQSSSLGGLVIQNTNEVNNTGGTVQALVAGSHVDVINATIGGGALATANGGVIQTVTGQSAGLDGLNFGTLNNTGRVLVNDASTLTLSGAINNIGAINENALSVNNTDIRLGSQFVTLQGGGILTISNNPNNRIFANNSAFQLINVDNTISGAGQIGVSQMTLINQATGVINADQVATLDAPGNIILNTAGNISHNFGLLEATNTGGLVIQNSTIDNAGGTLQASGGGAHVDVLNSTIEGGTLATAGGGVIQTVSGNSAVLDGLTDGTLNNSGTLLVNDVSTLTLAGTISNTGAINENGVSTFANTNIRLGSQFVTLQGGGSLSMSNDASNQIVGNSGAFQLINVNNTIFGAGQLGAAQMKLNNQSLGVINANLTASLTINTGGNIDLNTGLIEATNTVGPNGGLIIQSSTIDNAGGTIAALGNNTHVDLRATAVIEGGKLSTTGTGVIRTVSGDAGVLDGLTAGPLTILAGSTVRVSDASTLYLAGTIINNGTIVENALSASSTTTIRLTGPVVTLSGTGSVMMSNDINNQIFGSNNVFQLNNLSNKISGAGQIGVGQMELSNSGTISATLGTALVLNMGGGNSVNNATGKMIAASSGTGGLIMASGIFTNNGTVEADNGNFVTYQSGATDTNDAEGVLLGGIWRAASTGGGATVSVTGGAVVTDAATIVLSGAGSVFQAGDGNTFTTLESSLKTIAAGGQLQVLAARGYSTANALTDSGTVQLNGGTFHAGSLSIGAGGQLFGFGTLQNAPANSGKIRASGGTLSVTGAIGGSGTLQADSGATLTLNAASNKASTVVDNGTVSLAASAGLTVTGSVDATSTGTFKLNTSSTLEIAADLGASNKVDFLGGAILNIDAAAKWGTKVGTSSYAGPLMQSFVAGDKIDFKDLTFTGASTTGAYDPTTGLLQVTNGSASATLAFENASLGAGTFQFTNDGTGHTLVTLAAAPALPAGPTGSAITLTSATLADPTWTGTAGDNNFNTATNWSPSTVPGAGDAAVISLSGAAVNSNTSNTVATLAMSATTSLAVNSGTFMITGGSGVGGLAGTINANNATALSLTGTFTNSGVINENSAGSTTEILISGPTATLQGSGKVILSNSTTNFIFGTSASNSLVNVNNTIAGAGNIGDGQMTLVNQTAGIINANQTSALVLNTGGNVITNGGVLEGTGTGGLIIQSAVSNVGGTVKAVGAGAIVALQNTIMGGTVTTASGGVIQTSSSGSGSGLDGLPLHSLTNSGTIQVLNNTALFMAGSIVNNGTISLSSSGNNTDLRLSSPIVTLSGTGIVSLSDSPTNRIFGNGGFFQLVNGSTIAGAGQLGANQMTLINNALISATGATNALVVNTGNNIVVNTKTLQSSSLGGLVIQNTNEVNNTGGTVQALVAGSHVDLMESVIGGGTLATANGGVVQTITGHSAGLDGLNFGALDNSGKVQVNDNSTLTLSGIINNIGTIVDNALGANNTDIRLGSQFVTLQGGGTLTMSNDGNNRIFGNSGVFQLINADNTISGAGQIGIGQMTLMNQAKGTINANQTTALILNTGGFISYSAGLIEGTSTGGLVLQNMTLDNAGGTVHAAAAGTHVDLAGATIEGGTLTTAGGMIQTVSGNGTLDGLTAGTLNNSGSVIVNDNTTLTLFGIINNTGTITENALSTNSTDIHLGGQFVTLQGGGKLTMTNDTNNRILGNNTVFQLINVNNTISGAGQLGAGQMTLNNKIAGIINANQTASLAIGTGGNISFNAGLIEATNTTAGNAGLIIQGSTIDNAGGTIKAAGSNSHVDLTNFSVIEGGTIATSGGGVIGPTSGNSATLDGITVAPLTIAASSTVVINNNSALNLVGTITNNGVISETAGVNNADIHIAGPVVTLSGTGSVMMSNSVNNRIFGSNNVFQLNNLSNKISGAGQIGVGQMELSNSGTISATLGTALVLNMGGGNSVNNATGKMIAASSGTGGLIMASGIFTNNGTVEADNGNFVTYQSGATDTNDAEGVLLGGIWRAASTGGGATVSVTGGAVVTDAATIVLSGAGSVFQAGDGNTFTTLESSLKTIAAGGQLQVLAARGYSTANALADSGTVQLNGGTFHAGSLSIGAGGQLFGFGTLQNAPANSGKIRASGGTLSVTGAIGGSGTLQADSGATLTLNAASNKASTVVDNGTVSLAASAGLTVTGSVDATSTGTFKLNTSSTLEIAADLGASNKVDFLGGAILNIDAAAKWGTSVGTSSYAGPLMQSFVAGDKIDFKDLAFTGASTTGVYDPTTGLLQVTNGSASATLAFENASLGAGTFQFTNDGSAHTLVTLA